MIFQFYSFTIASELYWWGGGEEKARNNLKESTTNLFYETLTKALQCTVSLKLIFSYVPETILRIIEIKHPYFLNSSISNFHRFPHHNVYEEYRKYVKQTSTSSHLLYYFIHALFFLSFVAFITKLLKNYSAFAIYTYRSQIRATMYHIQAFVFIVF